MADLSGLQITLACFVSVLASTLGSFTGFGAGLILTLFLIPIIGTHSVVPVMAVAGLISNCGRCYAFRRHIHWLHARQLLWLGLPACCLGAYGYTLLNARWVGVALAITLLVSVAFRHWWLPRHRCQFNTATELSAGAAFGFINGGVTGTGVFLISILMSVGLTGPVLLATDALVSLVMGVAKVLLFGQTQALNMEFTLLGLVLGVATLPGAFIARYLLTRIPTKVHRIIMEAIVVIGAIVLLVGSLS